MNKKQALILTSIVIISTLLAFFSLRNGHEWGDDFALYIRQAQSLADGSMNACLKENSFAMANSTAPLGPDLYPWGFPLLISPLISIFGFNLLSLKLLVVAFYVFSLLVIYFLFKNKLGSITALLFAGVFAVNFTLISSMDRIMSDIPYFFFALLCLHLIQRTLFEHKILINKYINYWIIGFLIFYAYYVRSNGIVLLPTLFACQLTQAMQKIQRGNLPKSILKIFPGIIPYIVFLGLMLITNSILPAGSNSYLTRLAGTGIHLKYLLESLFFYLTKAPVDFYAPYIRSIYVLTLPFVLAGLIKNFKKDYLYIVYVTLTLLVFIFWPVKQGIRFIISILPFYFYFLLIGLRQTSALLLQLFKLRTFSKDSAISPQNIFCVLLILLFLIKVINFDRQNMKNNRYTEGAFAPASKDMYNFVTDNTKKDDLFIFFKARIFTWMTHRIAFMVSDPKQLLNSKANYLVIDKKIGSYDQVPYDNPIYHEKQEYFSLVFQNDEFLILKINHLAMGN